MANHAETNLYFNRQHFLWFLWDLQITLHKCEVWWVDVQCVCTIKVGWLSRSKFKVNIVWLYIVSALELLRGLWHFEITWNKCKVP